MRVPSLVVESNQFRIPRVISSRVAYKTTTFPCSSLNRDGILFSTCGLVVASEPGREPMTRPGSPFLPKKWDQAEHPHPSKIEGATVGVGGRMYAARDISLSP